MYALPGQLGGTVRMNARCYGGEISQIATSVTTIDLDGRLHTYDGRQAFRGYKDTIFMVNREMICEINFALNPHADRSQLERMMFDCEVDRRMKGQFDWPSCGCVFKNSYDIGVSSGLLLDAVGAKSLRVGHAVVSPIHANFVYNQGASAEDILELTFQMQELVFAKFGVWLSYEMELLGAFNAKLLTRYHEVRESKPLENLLAPLRMQMQGKV